MMAWATLLTQPGYAVGVRALHRSLINSGSHYPLVVMVTDKIDAATRQLMRDEGCLLRDVAPLSPNPQLANSYANARFAEVWTKLRVWTLTEFKRIAFLDADMLVTQNMDELFSLDLPADNIAACHACRCNPNQVASYPADWIPENCFYSWSNDVEQTERLDKTDNYLNGGFLLLTPDNQVFAQMLTQLAALDDLSGYLFAEQDFLNQFYRGRWQPLPYIYNALKTLPQQHAEIWQLSRVKNIHFIQDKPWDKQPDPADKYYQLDRLWWQTAADLKPV